MNQIRKARFSALVAGVCAATLVAPLFAQELEEIIVVARKREESLQAVPISITTFSEEDLAVQGIDSLEDIARQTAGVIFDKGFSPQDTRVVMRGLSPSRGRPNVAILLDDVDISSESIRTAGSSLSVNPRLIDIERIEVVTRSPVGVIRKKRIRWCDPLRNPPPQRGTPRKGLDGLVRGRQARNYRLGKRAADRQFFRRVQFRGLERGWLLPERGYRRGRRRTAGSGLYLDRGTGCLREGSADRAFRVHRRRV